MDRNRRNFLLTGLFGAGYAGLRALATGLPAAYFLNPQRALADVPPACAAPSGTPQYLILSIDQNGDPINANAPGMYDDPGIIHPPGDANFAKSAIKLGASTANGAAIWGTLPQWVLDRTCFFHLATQTTIHPDLPKVLSLMGSTANGEMLPSLASFHQAGCLSTIQPYPVSLCGTTASEYVSYQGRVLPNMNAIGLRDILTSPAGPLTNLQKLRDSSMSQLWQQMKSAPGVNPAQAAFIDNLATTRTQARSISDALLNTLGTISSNGADGQVAAAVALIKMNVAPVIVVRIPFGGDNHFDQNLAAEAAQTAGTTAGASNPVSGVPLLAALMNSLMGLGLQDQVTFASLNVFGRTLKQVAPSGRNHWADHQVSLLIGPKVRGSVVGGAAYSSSTGDYTAMPVSSADGSANMSGDLPKSSLLASFGKTLLASLGIQSAVYDQAIQQGKAITGILSA